MPSLRRLLASAACAMALSLPVAAVAQQPHGSQLPPADQARRPNIVFIMSDDHAVQALSAYGQPVSQIAPTPNIDRIADTGARFDNSFVTNSLCGPSRAAMLTGKFGHVNGFTQNGETFDTAQWTWPRALHEQGYQTAVVGKWHIGRTPGAINFDFWKILDDQGEYYNPDFLTPGDTQRVLGYATDLITAYSLDWLATKRDPDKPFVLMIHHKAPHRNFMPALRHVQRYQGVQFPVPETYFDDYQGRPAAAGQEMNIYRDMYEGHDLKMTVAEGSPELRYNRWPGAFDRMTPEQRAEWDRLHQADNDAMNRANLSGRELALWKYQRYMQEYAGTLAAVDEGVGRVLDYLDATGLSENTIIIYTSDQGFYLGEHGWFDKRFMYEESLRTPFLMRYPGHIAPGTEVDAMIQNIDYAPTILDYAGIAAPEAIQGRSLRPLAEERAAGEWRDSIYYHYYEFPGFHAVRAHYGVRTDRYKLIHFYGDLDVWEFYDLQADPHEVHNLIDDPAYADQIARLRRELTDLRARYGDTTPLHG